MLCYFSFSVIYRLADLETGEKSALHTGFMHNPGGWNCSASRELRPLAKNARDQMAGSGDSEEGEYRGVTTDEALVGDLASTRAKKSPLTASGCVAHVSEYSPHGSHSCQKTR